MYFLESENEVTVSSRLQETNELCDETEDRAEVNQPSDGQIVVDGIISGIGEGQELRSSIYGPSSDDSIACEIGPHDSQNDGIGCSGSVNYMCDIIYRDIDINEIKILHTNKDHEGTYVLEDTI
ncbi:hypothetical protein [Natrinema sp. SYSU A 869]|uniref:hypothetical protein n=1 Tax=Natrinema sp. SYSU A 869 TaxID=2871694 RepID=UPI001CA3EC96|nr:hypothetical protein [Natrinema sp. SYSU A 869]